MKDQNTEMTGRISTQSRHMYKKIRSNVEIIRNKIKLIHSNNSPRCVFIRNLQLKEQQYLKTCLFLNTRRA